MPAPITATLSTAPNQTVDGLMRKYDRVRGTPAHLRWGEQLVRWRAALQQKKRDLRGGSALQPEAPDAKAAQAERMAWNREVRKFRASCVGDPGDHGLCRTNDGNNGNDGNDGNNGTALSQTPGAL